MRSIIVILIFLFCGDPLTAQPLYNFKFKTYTSNDGLVHNFTKRCLQDSRGFLWIITQNGLSRFDGYSFKNFEHTLTDSTSMPTNYLEDIAIDSKDRIWLSYKKGLCFYDQNTHQFTVVKQESTPLKSYSILFDSKRNCIWSVNYDSYTKIDCNSLQIHSTPFKETDQDIDEINPLFLDSRDRLWIPYARNGYHCITLKNNSQYHYNKLVAGTAIYEDDEHNIWMSTWQTGFKKIIVKEDGHHEFINYGDPFMEIAQNELDYISNGITASSKLGGKNLLWVVKNTDGILLFDKKANKFIQKINYDPYNKNSITTDFIEWIYTDRDENIWVCTWHGIAKVNKNEQQFSSWELPELRGQMYNAISGIVNDPFNKNIYWQAVTGSGIVKYDAITRKIIHRYFYYYNDQAKTTFGYKDENYDWRWPVDLWEDDAKQIWAATYAGLIRIKNGLVSKLPLKNMKGNWAYLRLSKQIGKNSIWALGDEVVFKVNTLNSSYKIYANENTPNNVYYDIDSLDANNLILASKDGLLTFNTLTEKFAPLANGLHHNFSKGSVCIERIGNFLYTGNNNGLWKYDILTKQVSKIGIEQNIETIGESSLKKDANNNLWIYTPHGLFKYDTKKNIFEKFTTADGIYDLSDDQIKFFSYNNNFYLGYRMALTSFDPLKVNINTKKIRPYITDVYVNGQELNISINPVNKETLLLNYNQNELKIGYTAPDFTNADKIIFNYRLIGYDTTWVNAGIRRSANFTNLAPGNYSFEVIAANSSGLWNNKPTIFNFIIKTPFWQTWWFRLLVILILLATIYIIYHYRLKQIKKLYQVRSNISRSLHDEVGATLSSINIYSDVARNKTNDTVVKELINKVYDASANAMENMSDIVWYVNPKNDLLGNLLVRMREYALPLLEAKNINVLFESQKTLDELKTTMQQRQHLYLIFKEAINNATKYAAAENISIKIYNLNNCLNMEIADDGKGFDKAAVIKGNGLNNLQTRAKEINAAIKIDSTPGKGTTVLIQMQIT